MYINTCDVSVHHPPTGTFPPSLASPVESGEWAVLDVVRGSQLGSPLKRMRETVLLTQLRYGMPGCAHCVRSHHHPRFPNVSRLDLWSKLLTCYIFHSDIVIVFIVGDQSDVTDAINILYIFLCNCIIHSNIPPSLPSPPLPPSLPGLSVQRRCSRPLQRRCEWV